MRADMAKVIVERPRVHWRRTRKGRARALDELPVHEGMRRRHMIGCHPKILNENLAPLRRFLAAQVGRPWDKVYAEIAAHLRADSAVQQHVRDHLQDFVATKPRRDVVGWRSLIDNGLWWQELYVDPRTGVLRRTDQLPEEKARRRAERRSAPSGERVALSAGCELRLIKGLWYAVTLAPLPEPVYVAGFEAVVRPLSGHGEGRSFVAELMIRRLVTAPVRDVVTSALVEVGPAIDDPLLWHRYQRVRPDRRYAVAKRVLSRRELRRHGLSNTAS